MPYVIYITSFCESQLGCNRKSFGIIDLRFLPQENRGVVQFTVNSAPASLLPTGKRAALRRVSPSLQAILVLCVLSLTANTLSGETLTNNTRSRSSFRHWLQVGEASWYGLKFQGRRTANGEHFNMNSLTCAHRTLPLGSWVRVTNLRNRKSVLVRVNDRGPVPENRIVDLSYAAAHAVGLDGIGEVRLEAVPVTDSVTLAQLHVPVLPPL